jgi:hypothetical protein
VALAVGWLLPAAAFREAHGVVATYFGDPYIYIDIYIDIYIYI